MRISDKELNKVIQQGVLALIDTDIDISPRETDKELIDQVTKKVIEMGDREEMIEELKARIQSGNYNPSGEEIADAMIRRSIADRIK